MSKEQEALEWLEDSLKGIASYDGWFREFHKKICILRQALEDLELYKKAFEKATDNEGRTFTMVCVARNKTKYIRDYFLDQARKELSNERQKNNK